MLAISMPRNFAQSRDRRAAVRSAVPGSITRRRIMRPCLVPTRSGVSVMSSGGPVIDPRPAADLQMATPADRSIPPVGTLLPERRRSMNAIHHISAGERYARCIQTSKRVRWDVDEDVIRGRHFDLAHKFLPDGLSMADAFTTLSADEKRFVSQIQGRTYANVFGLVDRFITAKVLELSQDHCFGDQVVLEALIRF